MYVNVNLFEGEKPTLFVMVCIQEKEYEALILTMNYIIKCLYDLRGNHLEILALK